MLFEGVSLMAQHVDFLLEFLSIDSGCHKFIFKLLDLVSYQSLALLMSLLLCYLGLGKAADLGPERLCLQIMAGSGCFEVLRVLSFPIARALSQCIVFRET